MIRAISCAIACFIAAALSGASADARAKMSDFGVRFRATGLWGQVSYESSGHPGTAPIDRSGRDFGGALELENWFDPWVALRLELDSVSGSSGLDLGTGNKGKPPVFASGAASVGVKLLGGGGVESSELVGFLGAALSYFPVLHGYSSTPYYDTISVRSNGIRIGSRARIALSGRFLLEASGYFTSHLTIGGIPRAVNDKFGSYSLLLRLALERQFPMGVALGAGALYNHNRLMFRYAPEIAAETVEFDAIAPMVYFQFSF